MRPHTLIARATWRLGLGMALLLGATVGCGADPEANSGADAYRNQAAAMPLDEWITDDLSLDDGDRTDWRFVDLASDGKLTVQFHADEKSTSVQLGVYDRYGQPLASAQHPSGRTEPVSFTVPISAPGRVFIKVQATGGASSSYTLRATQGEGDKGGVDTPDF